MCAQVWDDNTAEVVQLCIGHMSVAHAEQAIDRVRVLDGQITDAEACTRARLGRERLERTLARLLHDFAARWCAGRGHIDRMSR